jgi:hypothetical protein
MDVPLSRVVPSANSSQVSELVPTNGGMLVIAGWGVAAGGLAVTTAVSANNKQKVPKRFVPDLKHEADDLKVTKRRFTAAPTLPIRTPRVDAKPHQGAA